MATYTEEDVKKFGWELFELSGAGFSHHPKKFFWAIQTKINPHPHNGFYKTKEEALEALNEILPLEIRHLKEFGNKVENYLHESN